MTALVATLLMTALAAPAPKPAAEVATVQFEASRDGIGLYVDADRDAERSSDTAAAWNGLRRRLCTAPCITALPAGPTMLHVRLDSESTTGWTGSFLVSREVVLRPGTTRLYAHARPRGWGWAAFGAYVSGFSTLTVAAIVLAVAYVDPTSGRPEDLREMRNISLTMTGIGGGMVGLGLIFSEAGRTRLRIIGRP